MNYLFTETNVTETTENSQAQPIRKVVKQYNVNGQVNQVTVFPAGSGVSYTNYFSFDDWANLVYRRLAVNPTSYRETFYSYANTSYQGHFVDFYGTNFNMTQHGCSTYFFPNNVGDNIHDRVAAVVEFPNGVGYGFCEALYSKFDSSGNLLQENSLNGTVWVTTKYTYDTTGYGNRVSRVDANGHYVNYTFSSTYQYAYLTQADEHVAGTTLSTSYAYNSTTGDRTQVTSPSGNVTNYGYDAIDRLTTITYPAIGGVRAQRRTSYDDVNNIMTAYDENNNYTRSYFDGLGRLTQTQTYANGAPYSTALSTYYWNDKVKTYTDPTGNVTTYTYDFFGRMLTLNHPDGTFKQWVYSDASNQVTAFDEKGHPTDYYYDWQNRLVTVTEHVGGQSYDASYTFDSVGNLLQIADAKNQITSYFYDNLNRLVQTKFPDTTFENRTYDNVGNLVSRRTQNNTLITYTYDEINRLTKITYPDTSTVQYSYDEDSNRVQMTDSSATTTYTYDPRSRLLSESRTINGQAYTLSYQYDAASNLIQLTYPDGYVLSYKYDALNRITTVGNAATLTYRKNNQPATISYGNGVQTAYSYDQLARITGIHTWNATATLLDLNYAYDPNGNPTSVNNGQETYGYDDLNRLTSASGPFGSLDYTYDEVGNRLSAVVNGTGTTYSYGSYNKLMSAGSTSYSYDNNGNTVSKTSGSSSWSYTYDYENRLKQVQLNGQTALQALYDGDGRRVQTTATDTTIYDYQAGSWDPCYVKDLTTGLTSDIVFAGGLLIGKVQAGVSSFYHLDRLGSVRLETQAASQPVFSAKYLPYGNTYATSGAEVFQFTGKQLDVATGLSYYGYRYYDSQSGRFMTLDLAQANYLNPQSLNRYTYALNNPERYVDPDGAKLPEAAYDIERVPGASAERSWEELDKELRDLEDAYEEYSSHHSHPMRFRAWLRMTFGAAANTASSDPAASTNVHIPRGALLALNYGTVATPGLGFIGIVTPRFSCETYTTGQNMVSTGWNIFNAAINPSPPLPASIPGPFGFPVEFAPEYEVVEYITIGVGLSLVVTGTLLEMLGRGSCPPK